VVPELVELVEDHDIRPRSLEFLALHEDFPNVGFRARGGDHLARHFSQPLEALPGHALGEDGNGLAAKEVSDVSAAAAVVPRGGPDGFVASGIELPGDEAGSKAPEGRAHFVGPGGKPFPHQGHDFRGNSGEFLGKDEVIHAAKAAAVRHRFILPGDAEKVPGMKVPKPDFPEFPLYPIRDEAGIAHLPKRGDEDVLFPGQPGISPLRFRMDREVNHRSLLSHLTCHSSNAIMLSDRLTTLNGIP
jgi:hypothetical protein